MGGKGASDGANGTPRRAGVAAGKEGGKGGGGGGGSSSGKDEKDFKIANGLDKFWWVTSDCCGLVCAMITIMLVSLVDDCLPAWLPHARDV